MDPNISSIIIAIVTGIFGFVIAIVQKNQSGVIKRIDKQTSFIEQEKRIKQELLEKEKECDMIVHQIMVLILDTNLTILKNTQLGGNSIDPSVFDEADKLVSDFRTVQDVIKEINIRYDTLLDLMRKDESANSKKK